MNFSSDDVQQDTLQKTLLQACFLITYQDNK